MRSRQDCLNAIHIELLNYLFVVVQDMLSLSEAYHKSVEEEATLTPEQLKTRHVGKRDPKRHLEEAVEKAMGDQVVQTLGSMLLAEL